jgi:hypothetical protein
MKLLEAVISYKFGRFKSFCQRRKEELELLPMLPLESQMEFLHQMVRQIASECEQVKGIRVGPGRVLATFLMKEGYSYTYEPIFERSIQELAEQIVDEVIIPYAMDLWESRAKRADRQETPYKKSTKLPA